MTGADAIIFRNFSIMERFNLEFRAEAFTVTNTPRFANPAASVTGSNFMEIRSTRNNGGGTDSDRQLRSGPRLGF